MVERISKESGRKKRVSKETKKTSKPKQVKEKTVEESISKRKSILKKAMIGSSKTRKGSKRGDKKRQKTKRRKRSKKNRSRDSTDESEVGSKRRSRRKSVENPKKVQMHSNDIEQEKFEKLLAKLKYDKEHPSRPLAPLDPKSKLLMDRVTKKSYPQKYVSKNKENQLREENESFYQASPAGTGEVQEDKYDNVPKLADVQKMPDEDLFVDGVPFWAEKPEPDEEETKDVEPPISIGAEHLEMYQDKKLTLKALKETKLVLDAYQPMQLLMKRDDMHFHPHLVFSNTIRSLINVCGKSEKEPGGRECDKESQKPIQFKAESPVHLYSRINPIQSVRKSTTTTTTTTTTPD